MKKLSRALFYMTLVTAAISSCVERGPSSSMSSPGQRALGAPSNPSISGQVLAVAEYSAVQNATALATIESVRSAGLNHGVEVHSISKHLGVPSFTLSQAKTTATTIRAASVEYLQRFRELYRMSPQTVATAKIDSIHDTGRGAIVVNFTQHVEGIAVYGVRMSVVMKRDRSLLALSGNLSPTHSLVRATSLQSRPSKADVVAIATSDIASGAVKILTERVSDVWYPFGTALESAQRIELEVTSPGSSNSRGYVYVVADDGRILERLNRTFSESFEYRVWADAASPFTPADGPHVSQTPHPTGTPDPVELEYADTVLIAMEGMNTNPQGTSDPWLAPGATTTSGNNSNAYADLAAPDGLGAGDIQADTNGSNRFDYTYDPLMHPADSEDQIKGAVTQMFYTTNWLHDYYYDSGFNESTKVAQNDNFGRGTPDGEGDAILVEAQDGSGRNNATMTTLSDGIPPRMQMFVFDAAISGGSVDRDGSLDNGIVAHEWGHYLHHRLSICDASAQCAAMSEGWGDFIAMQMVVKPEDDLATSVFASAGAYVMGKSYYGVRRVPYSTRFDRNALTFNPNATINFSHKQSRVRGIRCGAQYERSEVLKLGPQLPHWQ